MEYGNKPMFGAHTVPSLGGMQSPSIIPPGGRRRRLGGVPRPAPKSITAVAAGLEALAPLERLEQLTEIMRKVLTSYQNSPCPSRVHIERLKRFLHRALELNPNIDAEDVLIDPPGLDPLLGFGQGPGPYVGMGMAFGPGMRGGPSPTYSAPRVGRSRSRSRTDTRRPSGSSVNTELDVDAIDKLAKEWWSSHIVVTWYGPNLGLAPNPPSSPASIISRREREPVPLFEAASGVESDDEHS
ncbi:hypothetical protein DB88DRAFT_218940 [Papiliotrema laurentii]|uniref:Uncharacterized protein n=1 Tax=Papiliotrema laurentii TaxID=5418 RepID=A0AAD9FTG9_PAPLA|nr:hypothetical protein DB88DRAFT_218940 [Papiliotrema laurentii]